MSFLQWLRSLLSGYLPTTPTDPPPTPAPPVPLPPVPAPPAPAPPPTYDQTVDALLTKHNAVRDLQRPLKLNNALIRAAHDHAKWMATNRNMSHEEIPGTLGFTAISFVNRVAAANYAMGAGGENIAAGQATVDAVMRAWLNSPGHRANILNTKFTDVGFGVAYDVYHYPYWCAVLATSFIVGGTVRDLPGLLRDMISSDPPYSLPDAVVEPL